MIEHIIWPKSVTGERTSPFDRDSSQRPLSFAFHTGSLVDIPPEEKEALQVMRELAGRLAMPVPNTGPSQLPGVVLDDADGDDDLLLAREHQVLGRDILVTMSPTLLERRQEEGIRQANPRRPTEAAKILGLYLRSRGDYGVGVDDLFRLGQESYYWHLCYFVNVQSMWRYMEACNKSAAPEQTDAIDLGSSVMVRCARALEARDNVGYQFYASQSDTRWHLMAYHFDYLSLLLDGAIDAQARLARFAYGISSIRERRAYFDKDDYREALLNAGADELHGVVRGASFENVRRILGPLRNSIHGKAPLHGIGRKRAEDETHVDYIHLEGNTPDEEKDFLQAAEVLGGAERWGLMPGEDLRFEPYTLAVALVDRTLALVDEIAKTTDVGRLLPDGGATLSVSSSIPLSGCVMGTVRRHLEVLG